nr:retrovirus-related Pol polyprotein from transposon TNT 1-94 [Tanacetum cinerariifolium]
MQDWWWRSLMARAISISSSGDAEVLLVRGRSQKKGTDKRWRSKSRQRLSKDECAFCHKKAEANVTKCDDENSNLSLATSSSKNASEIWLLDFACSHHITPHREWFSNFEEHEEVVYTADETPLTTHGIGSVRLQNEDGTIVTLKGARYSPKLKKNLIFVGTLESKGFEVRAKDEVMKIISGVLVVMKGIRKINNTYHYKGRTVVGTVAAVTDGDRNSKAVKLWHMRLGHAREKSLNLLIKQGLLKGLTSCKLDLYEHCINRKTTRVKIRIAIHKIQCILDYVHSDTMDEVLGVFIKWKKMMETQTCRKIKHLRTYNGREYKNDLFTKFRDDEGIVRNFTVRHTPQQNGVAERMNRSLLEKVRCMLSNAGLGKEFWAEAVTYACHLVNRLPSTAIDGKTSFEKWYGKPVTDYDSLHVFGFAAYYHVNESKLDPRAKKALFMGITSGIKGYRLWCPETKKTIFSMDVTFNESAMLKKVNAEELDGTPKKVEFKRIIVPADGEPDDNSPIKVVSSEESDMGVDQPPRREEGNWMQVVYAKKEGFPGQDDVHYKARLVAKGYSSDDMLIASQSLDETEKLKTQLKSEFEIKDLGEAKMILGMEIDRDKKLRNLCLTQKQYLRRVLKRFRYMHNPRKGHWQAVKWILRYIHNTVDVGIVFEHVSSQWVEGYCNSDYARDLDKRRSTKGYVFTMAKALVSWKSTLQSTTALSTTEAEYMAMIETVKEAIWLQGLLGELGIKQRFVTMHSDSQSALHLVKNQVYHARTKHIDVRYHFIREILEEGEVRIQKIHISKNPADMLTKVVAGIKFTYCLDLINVVKT